MIRRCVITTGLLALFLAGCQSQPPAFQTLGSPTRITPLVASINTVYPVTALNAYPGVTSETGQSAIDTAYPVRTPYPTRTPDPTHTATPVPPTQAPSPTFAATLVQPVTFNPHQALPEGMSVNIYHIGRPVIAEDFDYDEIQAIMKEQSLWYSKKITRPLTPVLTANIGDLAQFGYRFKVLTSHAYRDADLALYKNNKLLMEEIELISPISINRSKTDFVMAVGQPGNKPPMARHFLVRKDTVEPLLYGWSDLFGKYSAEGWPRFIGDDLIYAAMEPDPVTNNRVVRVYRNDEMIYQTHSDVMHVRPMLVGLWTYADRTGDHWILEVLDGISIDGHSLMDQYGYQKSYEFHLLNGRPVFMFEKDGVFGLNVDGHEILLPGDSVPHYNCCSGTLTNPRFADNGLIFFLKNGSSWDYVEVALK